MLSLFDGITIGALPLANRLMRSATAERLADAATGSPTPRMAGLYQELAKGGVALIVTGHAYVERQGKAHAEMAGIDDDTLIPAWREVIRPAQDLGTRVMMQINHCGANCDPAVTAAALSPSGVATNELQVPRAMSEEELARIVLAFGQSARRAREAGCDGVQIHGAHGYLVTQFLTPFTNHREDGWGGDALRRRTFLKAIVAEMRRQVGDGYPLWLKLGMAGCDRFGLTIAEGAQIVADCTHWGVDGVEISCGMGVPEALPARDEAPFLPMAEAARQAVGPDYPLALVNRLRTRVVMDEIVSSGAVQLISLCRPLILEPDLPARLRDGRADRARCVTCNRCWPEALGEGVACHNTKVREDLP